MTTLNGGPAAMFRLNAVTVQHLIDTIAGKPGASLDDVAAALQLLAAGATPADLQALVDAAVGGLQTGVDEAAVNALIEAQLTAMGPVIQQAVASQVGRFSDKVDFNVAVAGDGPFVVQANNLTGANHRTGIDFRTQRDGEVTVNGKRVLTVDDALAAGGAGIDQAAVEAAVAAATAPLLARITALETEVAKKAETAYVQEQFGNFNDLIQADITGLAQALDGKADKSWVSDELGTKADKAGTVAFMEQQNEQWGLLTTAINTSLATKDELAAVEAKAQGTMDVLGGRKNATLVDVTSGWEGLAQYAQGIEQWANQTFGEVVEYVSVEIENLKAALAALPTGGGSVYGEWIAQALTGTLGATLAEVNRAVDSLARKTDPQQVITAKSITVEGIKIGGEGGGVLAYVDDEYGYRLRLIDPGVTAVEDAGIVVTHLDLVDILGPGNELPAKGE